MGRKVDVLCKRSFCYIPNIGYTQEYKNKILDRPGCTSTETDTENTGTHCTYTLPDRKE
jgi:hypothetical protein